MEISDDFKNELETILEKWIKLLHDLDPQFMEMLKLQLDYENRLESLQTFLRNEVDQEMEKAFHSEFPNDKYTPNVKKELAKITSNFHDPLLETIKKLA